jgi:hypothetical protein
MYKCVLYCYEIEDGIGEPSGMTSKWNSGRGRVRRPHGVRPLVCEAHEVEGGGGGGAVSKREQDGVEWRRRRAVEKVRMGAGGGTTQRPTEPRQDRRPVGEEGEAGASMLWH